MLECGRNENVKWRKNMNKLLDFRIDLKLRLFYVLSMTACIANTLGYVTNAILYGIAIETIFPLCCALIIYGASAYGIYNGKTRIPIAIILVICNVIEFPVLYCMCGPYRLAYMILGIVATMLFLEGRKQMIATSMLIMYDCVFIIWKMIRPDFFAAFAVEDSVTSAIITFLIAGSSIAAMLGILIKQHEEQQKCMKGMTKELQRMANIDPLTQLYNRRYLTQYLEEKEKESGSGFTVILLDIDDFKGINDTYGHMFGDEVLQTFSEILLRHMKGYGIVTRFGGEEFMLVFNSGDKEEIQKVLKVCAREFKQYGMERKKIQMTFSGGVAVYQKEEMLTTLFNTADERLYRAKKAGKKQVVFN